MEKRNFSDLISRFYVFMAASSITLKINPSVVIIENANKLRLLNLLLLRLLRFSADYFEQCWSRMTSIILISMIFTFCSAHLKLDQNSKRMKIVCALLKARKQMWVNIKNQIRGSIMKAECVESTVYPAVKNSSISHE